MTELLELVASPLNLLWILLGFGFAPGFCLRLIVLLYPAGHPRRKELVAELYAIKRPLRPLFVAEQFETALFEGIPERRKARKSGKEEAERLRLSRAINQTDSGRINQAIFWIHDRNLQWKQERANRNLQREQDRANAEMITEIRWLWRRACMDTALMSIVNTASGPTRAVPVIGHVELGPPIALTVKLRPGQTYSDFANALPSIAPAMGMVGLRVTPLVPSWVQVVLVCP
jgi:hypothetical protein